MADPNQQLARPIIIDRNPGEVVARLVSEFEQSSGRTLYPAQVERLIVNQIAYAETLIRVAIQYTFEQSLVEYATGLNLEHLGALLGVSRLAASKALTTIRFTLDNPLTTPLVIPKNSRISASNNTLPGGVFLIIDDVIIPAGSLTADIQAECGTAGESGNGFSPGDISLVLDPIAGVTLYATNLTPSAGGSSPEGDDRLRERIKLAPEGFSNAGSEGAYKFWALTAHPSIIDVGIRGKSIRGNFEYEQPPENFKVDIQAIANGELTGIDLALALLEKIDQTPWVDPGVVEVYPLVAPGALPSAEVKQAVFDMLSDTKIRPLTDYVKVLDPVEQIYQVEVNITTYRWADIPGTQGKVQQALNLLINNNWRKKLGVDIVVSQIISACQGVYGVYQCVVVSPANTIVLQPNQWGNCTEILVNMVGEADG